MTDFAISYRYDRDLLLAEAITRREEGAEPAGIDAIVSELPPDPPAAADFAAIYRELEAVPQRADWPYVEPSDLAGIRAERQSASAHLEVDRDTLLDRLRGAWLGRAAGCLLGKPFEGLTRQAIYDYLEPRGEYPPTDYIPAPRTLEEQVLLNPSWRVATRGSIDGMPRDDDLDYPILNLTILEAWGQNVRPADVAFAWLHDLPYAGIYTAERMAYRNLVDELDPPLSASRYNPYREWIGAQIRADAWGYVNPGEPQRAAELAWRDAAVSHTKNGIYGEMFVAALLAACLAGSDLQSALHLAAGQIPARSRLADVIHTVRGWHAEDLAWSQCLDRIEACWDRYHWVHTLNNAAVVVAALLYGGGNPARSMGLAVAGGWDTDCNGATVGSVLGALLGAGGIPHHLTEPLHDEVQSYVIGEGHNRLSDLAARTYRLVE